VTEDYQTLLPPHRRFPLATFPSPLERAYRLEDALRNEGAAGPRIYLKRDDVLTLGMGGNKVRNLEFSIGHALADGATDVVTAGRQQSNHCRLTAAACARAGLAAHLVFTGRPPVSFSGNLLLDELLGARLCFSGSDVRADRERMVAATMASLEAAGRHPHAIPVGGSDPRGALGHVLAAFELAEQMRTCDEARWSVVLATATGATQAGLLAGLRKLGLAVPVRGFAVAKGADELRADVAGLVAAVALEIGVVVDPDEILVDGSMLGGGYGARTFEAQAAIEFLARTEGVFADPVYTGKALAGLLALVRNGALAGDEAVVFVHTGGAPALFA
jgi:1-aminocyclopropane-1-carboxylate deaminase/D-cysteine desulfhydrase-like pyridoxal-dependent ACC family enzyme